MRGAGNAALTRAYQTLAQHGLAVEWLTGDKGDAFAFGGDLERELLALTTVHPLRHSALLALLAKADTDMAVVEGLLHAGALKRVHYAGETFYVHRLPAAAPGGGRSSAS